MIEKGAILKDIEVVIGPAIQQKNYEVGEDLRRLVLKTRPVAKDLFVQREKGKYLFNLPGFVEMRLHAVGINRVHNLGIDTYGESSGLFSHRRATRASLRGSGRQISVIGIVP